MMNSELGDILRFGSEGVFEETTDDTNLSDYDEQSLEQLLDRSRAILQLVLHNLVTLMSNMNYHPKLITCALGRRREKRH